MKTLNPNKVKANSPFINGCFSAFKVNTVLYLLYILISLTGQLIFSSPFSLEVVSVTLLSSLFWLMLTTVILIIALLLFAYPTVLLLQKLKLDYPIYAGIVGGLIIIIPTLWITKGKHFNSFIFIIMLIYAIVCACAFMHGFKNIKNEISSWIFSSQEPVVFWRSLF